MAVDFSNYMNIPIGQMHRVTLPPGHYFGRVKAYEPKESASGKPMLNVRFTIDSPGEDVDTSALPAQGCAGKVINVNYMMDTDFGQDDIRKLIEACGVATDPTQGWGQYLPQIENQPVKMQVDNRRMDKADPTSELTEDVKKVLAPT